MSTRRDFAHRLRSERKRARLSQQEFGLLGGVSRNSQAEYEAGKVAPSIDYIYGLEAAEIDVGYLVTGKRSGAIFDEHAREMIERFLECDPADRRMILDLARRFTPPDGQRPAEPRAQASEENAGRKGDSGGAGRSD